MLLEFTNHVRVMRQHSHIYYMIEVRSARIVTCLEARYLVWTFDAARVSVARALLTLEVEKSVTLRKYW
jgi:hypothetical protein